MNNTNIETKFNDSFEYCYATFPDVIQQTYVLQSPDTTRDTPVPCQHYQLRSLQPIH